VLTDEGVRAAEKLAGVESFYTAGNMEWPHLIDNSLKAHHLYKRDVNYVIENGEIIIVDEFTGRKMPGRQWSDGLHQSVEAKEGVRVKEETQTLATITLQNFFKLYKKICGMTGTAMTEASEFWKIYKLDVIAIPSNRELQRINHADVIYLTEKDKFNQVANEIERIHKWDTVELTDGTWLVGTVKGENEHEITFDDKDNRELRTLPRAKIASLQKKGRPILVGTVSIEKSERLSALLERRGIEHEVLNAKHHKREAEIVAQAGRKGAVTIATNMAGRGTDIILGGNPEAMAWAQLQDKYPTRLEVPPEEWDALVKQIEEREKNKIEGAEVKELGGLHIIGTERHEARRIDNQLRGRSGRQGDPGSGRFYLSLEDDLMRIFAGDWVKSVLTRLGMKEGEAIESRMVSRRIEGAQKKVEERNFDIRKNLLEYDEVMDEQRKRVYSYRQRILHGGSCKDLILEMIDGQIEQNLAVFLDKDYGAETFAKWAGNLLSVELDSREFQTLEFETAQRQAKDTAQRMAESQIFEAVEENLPEESEEDWNWESLAKFANVRWKADLRDRDLKKAGRDGVTDLLMQASRDAINDTDLHDGARFLEPDHGLRTVCGWVNHKFAIQINPDEVRDLEPEQLAERLRSKARETYTTKEAEFPVLAGLLHFTTRDASGQKRYDRDQLIAWARERFQVDLTLNDVKNKSSEQLFAQLVEYSRANLALSDQAKAETQRLVDNVFTQGRAGHAEANGTPHTVRMLHGSGWRETIPVRALLDKLKTYDPQFPGGEIAQLTHDDLRLRAETAVDDHFRTEMRKLERSLVLQILDAAWKDHLLAMDHLRSSVAMRGYAQIDPKVEYKREGMSTFNTMWISIGDRVTDLIFRMEQLDESFVGSTWKETSATHEAAPPPSDIGQQQQSAIDSSQGERKIEPIRNREERVGRNDPCPCGSGKKFKNCHMRKQGGQVA
ncbi:MAG TPA: SEC-C metal-binding domain-containing protein, partial [Pirellulales bacterium]|jgi:preprotein translocase subunit SecA